MTETKLPETKANKKELDINELYAAVARLASNRVQDYKTQVKHTGGYLQSSLVFAYSKGINDTLKLLLKELSNEKK